MNDINWARKAVKQLKKLPRNVQRSVVENVGLLTDFKSVKNVKALSNHQYDYRLRVGNYRVMFNHDSDVEIVNIEEVKKRDERTY